LQDKTNACGDRIVYDRPEDAAGWRQEHYHDAIDDVEDVLAIIAEMQEARKNESGEITEPLTETEVNTVLELKRLHLDSALGVLDVVDFPEGQYR
jgi:hypothetical protein